MNTSRLHRQPLVLACAALLTVPAHAATSQEEMLRFLEKMNSRLEQLEQRNAELEKQIKTQPAPALESRIKTLEASQAKITEGLDSDRISENEPELTSRLKAVEKDALSMKKAAKKIDALDGLKTGVSLTTIAQRPNGLPPNTTNGSSQLNYRADATIELPLAPMGDTSHKLFAHFRIGQGQGVNTPLSALGGFAAAPNAVAFRASGAAADDSVPILGQAWYQASIPIPFGEFKAHSREKLEVTFGKMDIFGFFDQNVAAGDEGRQFLNSAFVHNPLLDAGAQIGADANAFQPGFIASYLNESSKPETWRLSLGIFGSGPRGANYQRTLASPLVIVQAETARKFFDGLTGNYRLYTWQRSEGSQIDGTTAHHSGWGASVDQKISAGLTLFGRYGQQMAGKVRFDRALTLGSEINGSYWSRSGDALGVAAGILRASNVYRDAGLRTLDVDGNGTTDIAYTPGGSEKLAEIYYRYRVSKQFELSPNFQHIAKLGGNTDASSVKIIGLRAQFAF